MSRRATRPATGPPLTSDLSATSWSSRASVGKMICSMNARPASGDDTFPDSTWSTSTRKSMRPPDVYVSRHARRETGAQSTLPRGGSDKKARACARRRWTLLLCRGLLKALEFNSVPLDPAADRTHRPHQRTGKGREAVLDPRRRQLMNAPCDQPATLLRVPHRASLEQSEQRDRPFVGEQFDHAPRTGNTTQRLHRERASAIARRCRALMAMVFTRRSRVLVVCFPRSCGDADDDRVYVGAHRVWFAGRHVEERPRRVGSGTRGIERVAITHTQRPRHHEDPDLPAVPMVLPMPRRHEVGVAERPARDVIAAFEEDELGAVRVRGWPHDGSLVPRRCWRRRIVGLLRYE